MDYRSITFVFGCLLSQGSFAYFNETYGNYSFILADVYASNILGGSSLQFAQEWCRSHAFGYTLATAPDEDAHNRLTEFIRAANSSGQISSSDLILLNGKLYVPLPSVWTWINGKPLLEEIFFSSKVNLTQDYYYGFMIYYYYGSASARSYLPYICEYSGNCSMDDSEPSLNDRCYRGYYDPSTWYEARNKCLKEGGDLASFDDFNEMIFRRRHFFRQLWYQFEYEESWIGLQHQEWRWQDADNKQIAYTNWINGYPGGFHECLCLQSLPTNDTWLWKSCSCESIYRFICSADISSIDLSKKSFGAPKHETAPGHDNWSSGFSAGIGVGITIGFGVLIILAIVLLVIYLKSGKRQNSSSRQETPDAVYDNCPESQSKKDMKRHQTKEKPSCVESSVSEENQTGVTYEALRRGATPGETPDGLRIYDALEFHT